MPEFPSAGICGGGKEIIDLLGVRNESVGFTITVCPTDFAETGK